MLKTPLWLQVMHRVAFLSRGSRWRRTNVTGNRCTGLGNCNGKSKEWVSWWRNCARKSLRTSLLAGSEISESQAKFVPFLFSTFVVDSPDFVGRWVCIMDRWMNESKGDMFIRLWNNVFIFLTAWFKRFLGCFLPPITEKSPKSGGAVWLEGWDLYYSLNSH